MRFEWNEAKRRSNIEKHAIDFRDVAAVFDGRLVMSRQSSRDREERFVTVGAISGRIVAVVWTWRGENCIRIISARRARDAEERHYRRLLS